MPAVHFRLTCRDGNADVYNHIVRWADKNIWIDQALAEAGETRAQVLDRRVSTYFNRTLNGKAWCKAMLAAQCAEAI